MQTDRIPVGLVVERRTLDNPWTDHAWMPVQLFPAPPATPPWTVIAGGETVTQYYAGEVELMLYSTETANYLQNLAYPRPLAWVALNPEGSEPPVRIVGVTVDPAEGEAFTETGTLVVETVPLPDEIAARVASFVAAHHVERPTLKRRRDRPEPELLQPRELKDGE